MSEKPAKHRSLSKAATGTASERRSSRGESPGKYNTLLSRGDDEVSLVDLWLIFVRRRWLILGVFLVTLLASILLNLAQSPIYQARGVVQIGKLADLGMIEQPAVAVLRLQESFVVSANEVSPGIIAIEARADSPNGAQELVNKAANHLIDGHSVLYEQIRSDREARMQSIDAEIQSLEARIAQLEGVSPGAETREAVAISAIMQGDFIATAADLRVRRAALATSLSPIQSFPTRFMREPALPAPTQPALALYMFIGLGIGLVFGAIAALAVEFIVKAHEEVEQRRFGLVNNGDLTERSGEE